MKYKRLMCLDFLKGLAVIFMVIQHLGIWMWKIPWNEVMANYKSHLLYVILNILSGLSAPIFITAAGIGAFIFLDNRGDEREIIKRGIILLGLGYIHNLTILNWFSWCSWYVLHLMGIALVLSPLIYKIRRAYLLWIMLLIIFTTYIAQTLLDTSLILTNKNMSDMTLPAAYIRLALLEGHFPILPWFIFFLAGFYFASDIVEGNIKDLSLFSTILIFFSICLSITGVFFPNILNINSIKRLFSLTTRFYPMLLPMTLFLVGITVLLFGLVRKAENNSIFKFFNQIIVLGRFSLSVFFIHVFAKSYLYFNKLNQTFEKPAVILVIWGTLIFFTFFGYLSRRNGYKYTLEGLLRLQVLKRK